MQIDLGSAASLRDPAGYFAAAREGGDIQWSDLHRAWLVLSHAEVEAGFRDATTLSSDRTGPLRRVAASRSAAFERVVELLSGWMNFRDPPFHTRLREPVRSVFTPRAISALEPEIRSIVAGTLDRFDGDVVDLSQAFAKPIPALVIAAMLGVEGEERHRLQRWSDDLSSIVFAITPGEVDEAPILSATEEFSDFFSGLIERERAHPSRSLLSAIIAVDDSDLTHLELIGACTLLLFAGHETTTTLLINALGLLLERPQLAAWLRDHPEADATAVDEFLRVVGPARTMVRKVAADHERGGQQLRRGQNVFLSIAAANHDPAVFERPAEIDLERDPNPHFGFGWGLHFCLGATLGRLEARIALRALLERFPALAAEGPVSPPRASALGFGRRPLLARLGQEARSQRNMAS